MTTTRVDILSRNDAGQDVPTIAAALGVTLGYIYGVLREERPNRPHGNRGRRKSELRTMILGLRAQGILPARIAFLMKKKCARQYVYRILAEG